MMKTRTNVRQVIPIVLLALAACSTNDTKDTTSVVAGADASELVAEVDTVVVHRMPFKSDVISNGRVKASRFADIYFRNAELISEVYVKNGERVKRGAALAKLDIYKLNAERDRQAVALEQARLELQDVLIGQGYNPDDQLSIPADVLKLARVRSGYDSALTLYNLAEKDIEQATIVAPFDGVVANVSAASHSMASVSEPFCRVVSDNSMEVEFSILESEMSFVKIGEPVEITPFNGGELHYGHVTEVNPIIDENGHVTVGAVLNDAKGLVDGMNVRVRSSRNLSARLVVPKSAVVLRTNRQVIFTYENGRAMWNYVTTGLENYDSYEIVDGLNEGASVIVKGNENLAHESPVKILSTTVSR